MSEYLNEYSYLAKNSLIAIQGPSSHKVIKFLKIPEKLFFMESFVTNY